MYISEGGNRLEQSSNGHDGDDEGMKSIKNMKKRKKERVKNQRECSLAEERENHFNKGNQRRKISKESQSNWKSNSVGRTRGRIGNEQSIKGKGEKKSNSRGKEKQQSQKRQDRKGRHYKEISISPKSSKKAKSKS